MATKIPRKQRGPEAHFGFLDLRCGASLEFIENGVFLNGPEETFTVADQKKAVTYEYEKGEDYEVYTDSLKNLTDELLKRRNQMKKRRQKVNLNVQPIRFWIHVHGNTRTKLTDIYEEKKRQYYAQKTTK